MVLPRYLWGSEQSVGVSGVACCEYPEVRDIAGEICWGYQCGSAFRIKTPYHEVEKAFLQVEEPTRGKEAPFPCLGVVLK